MVEMHAQCCAGVDYTTSLAPQASTTAGCESAAAVHTPATTPNPSGVDAPCNSTPYNQLYPINALRNLALSHASTPLVLPVDADFIFSRGLEQQLHALDPGYSILDGRAAQLDAAGGTGYGQEVSQQDVDW